jgi:hypothetical protein
MIKPLEWGNTLQAGLGQGRFNKGLREIGPFVVFIYAESTVSHAVDMGLPRDLIRGEFRRRIMFAFSGSQASFFPCRCDIDPATMALIMCRLVQCQQVSIFFIC